MACVRSFELISLIAAIQDSNLFRLKSVFCPNGKFQFIHETDFPAPENGQATFQVIDMVLAFSEELAERNDRQKLNGKLSFIDRLLAYSLDLESRNLSMQSVETENHEESES